MMFPMSPIDNLMDDCPPATDSASSEDSAEESHYSSPYPRRSTPEPPLKFLYTFPKFPNSRLSEPRTSFAVARLPKRDARRDKHIRVYPQSDMHHAAANTTPALHRIQPPNLPTPLEQRRR